MCTNTDDKTLEKQGQPGLIRQKGSVLRCFSVSLGAEKGASLPHMIPYWWALRGDLCEWPSNQRTVPIPTGAHQAKPWQHERPLRTSHPLQVSTVARKAGTSLPPSSVLPVCPQPLSSLQTQLLQHILFHWKNLYEEPNVVPVKKHLAQLK